MNVDKKEVAAQLKEAANLLEVLGEDSFRARAYRSAGRALESYEGDFEALLQTGRLTEVRGIGQSLATEIATLLAHERLAILDELYERVPVGVREFFLVSGLGAKKIGALWGQGIETLHELVLAADDGHIAALKGFGKKSAENIAQNARFVLSAKTRMRLDEAEAYAELLAASIVELLPTVELRLAGELRRACETVGGLEFLIAGASVAEAAERLGPLLTDAVSQDKRLTGGFQGKTVTFTVVDEQVLGAALALRTGSAVFVDGLIERAAARGFDLNEQGLRRQGNSVATPDEASLFEKLRVPYLVPERREWAEPAPVADLITTEDIRGAVHNHSSWSDGAVSLREMVAAARARGFSYLAMADHSKSSYVANGLSEARVEAQAVEIAAIRAELADEGSDFELLHGIEVDIMSDGGLDYDDSLLARLDYTVVSVHQNFTLSEREQTERIVRAVHNPFATILAHPTGRLLLRRPAYSLNLEAVIAACAETDTVIEINANPYRLDLDWRWVIEAKAAGCRFSINPDAHQPGGLDLVPFGVKMARKAGLTPRDVVNTAPGSVEFLAQLKTAKR